MLHHACTVPPATTGPLRRSITTPNLEYAKTKAPETTIEVASLHRLILLVLCVLRLMKLCSLLIAIAALMDL